MMKVKAHRHPTMMIFCIVPGGSTADQVEYQELPKKEKIKGKKVKKNVQHCNKNQG